MRRLVLAVVLALLVAACSAETAQSTTTTGALEVPATSTTTVVDTTTTATLPIVIAPFGEGVPLGTQERQLRKGVLHEFPGFALGLAVTPPDEGWSVLGFRNEVAILFAWSGPVGFRPETLDVLVFDPGTDVDAAWERFGTRLDQTFGAYGETWQWVETGTMSVGGQEVVWREIRMPSELFPDRAVGDPRVMTLTNVGRAVLWVDTTARVAVVESDGLTLTIVAYETRCACDVQFAWSSRVGHVDAEENELGDWIPELESFLASMEIGA